MDNSSPLHQEDAPRPSRRRRKQCHRTHATIRDVAKMAGVSETTVSLTFRSNTRISKETRQRVLTAAAKLQYVPNLNARALRVGSVTAIGFLINDITNPFYAEMVNSAESIAQNRGYQVTVANSHWDPKLEVQAVENLISSRVRGMLICPCEKTHESLDRLSQYSIPCIAVDTIPHSYRGALIGNDLAAAGRLGAQHLLDVSCRRLALLTTDPQTESFSAFVAIKKGFLDELTRRGIDSERVAVVNAGLTINGGKIGFQRLQKRAPDVDGILCINDLCAIGVIEAAEAKGIRIGPNLAVMGIDDLEVSKTARISLTSLRQPYDRIIEIAVNVLIDSIESEDAPDINMVLPPELIVRSSTRRIQQ